MVSPSKHRAGRRLGLVVGLALAGVLLAGRPAAAQVIVITPDRSVVSTFPPVAVPVNNSFAVTPVISADRRWVRIGGSFSFTVVDPNLAPAFGGGFIKPWTISDRARASNFLGIPGYNPNPVITGPFRRWWP
jgi:hypothetical protein